MGAIANCPYNCDKNYKAFDPLTQALIDCPYCTPLRRKGAAVNLTTKDDLTQHYGVTLDDYREDKVIPVKSLPYLDEDSLTDFRDSVNNVLQILSTAGISLDHSYMFGVTEKGDSKLLASAFVKNMLMLGTEVAPLITASEYNEAVEHDNFEVTTPMWKKTGCVVIIDNGTSRSAIQAIKGLLEIRGLHNMATIVVTTWSMQATARLLSWKDENSFSQCDPHFVLYKSSKKEEKDWYIRGIVGLDSDSTDDIPE